MSKHFFFGLYVDKILLPSSFKYLSTTRAINENEICCSAYPNQCCSECRCVVWSQKNKLCVSFNIIYRAHWQPINFTVEYRKTSNWVGTTNIHRWFDFVWKYPLIAWYRAPIKASDRHRVYELEENNATLMGFVHVNSSIAVRFKSTQTCDDKRNFPPNEPDYF